MLIYLQKLYKIRLIITSTYQSFLKLILLLEMYQVFKFRMIVFIIFNSRNYSTSDIQAKTPDESLYNKIFSFPDSLEWKCVPFLLRKKKLNKVSDSIKYLLEWLVCWNYIVKNCLKLSPFFSFIKFFRPFLISKPYSEKYYSVFAGKSTPKCIFKTIHMLKVHISRAKFLKLLTNIGAII